MIAACVFSGKPSTLVDDFHRQVALIDGVTCTNMSRRLLLQKMIVTYLH